MLHYQNNHYENLNNLLEKISAPCGNSFREIVFGGPFICVLDILVGLFTHILIYLFIGLLYFDMDKTHITYNQPILYKQFYTVLL